MATLVLMGCDRPKTQSTDSAAANEYSQVNDVATMTPNCSLQDIEVTLQEFEDAWMRADQENMIRSDREPDAADTAALRAWAKRDGTSLDPLEEEPGYISFEETCECIEIAIGDYCYTILKDDTVAMQACGMVLSADWPRYFAGFNMDWGADDSDEPAYICIYPVTPDLSHVGTPYIYQTTPDWKPTGCRCFWASDGWLYVEGYDSKNDQTVYHKLHL